MFQTIFNVFVVVIGGLLVRRVRRLSAERAGVIAKLDTLSETVRDDFAAQWQQQFRSKALDKDHQSELETIISVQAERLAAQGKQISVLREKADTSVTQNDDIQTHQQELIESLQTQLDNLREKTEDMFRAQAAQFNHRFAFQQELRAEYDRLAKLVQAMCIYECNKPSRGDSRRLYISEMHNALKCANYDNHYDAWINSYPETNGYGVCTKEFVETLKNLC